MTLAADLTALDDAMYGDETAAEYAARLRLEAARSPAEVERDLAARTAIATDSTVYLGFADVEDGPSGAVVDEFPSYAPDLVVSPEQISGETADGTPTLQPYETTMGYPMP